MGIRYATVDKLIPMTNCTSLNWPQLVISDAV